MYNPLAMTLYISRDVVFREGKRFIPLNRADKASLIKHNFRHVTKDPKPTEKSPTWDEYSESQAEESYDSYSLPEPLQPVITSWELGGLETSLGDASMPLAEGSHRNDAGKDKLVAIVQLALQDEKFENVIAIYAAAVISNIHNHEDENNNRNSFIATMEYPLGDNHSVAISTVWRYRMR